MMRKTVTLLAGVAIAWLAVEFSTFAAWTRVQLASGAQVCQNENGDQQPTQFTKKTQASSAGIVCAFLNAFGAKAEAQSITLQGVVKKTTGGGNTPPPALHSPWLECDVGSPPAAGVAFNGSGSMSVTGAGDVGSNNNNNVLTGHLVYQPITGPFDITTTVQNISGTQDYREAGLIATDVACDPSLWAAGSVNRETQSAQQAVAFHLSNSVNGRATTYASAAGPQPPPQPIRLSYDGTIVSFYYGTTEAGPWTLVDSEARAFSGTNYIGTFVSSGSLTNTELSTATLTEPTITIPSGNAGTLSFTQGTLTIIENAGSFTACVSRNGGTSGAISAHVHASGGTATGSDWTTADLDQTLSWGGADAAQKCTTAIHVTNRAGTQGSRTIVLSLTTFTGGASAGGQSTEVVTIVDFNAVTSAKKFHPGVMLTADRNNHTTSTQSERFSLYDAEGSNTHIQGWHYLSWWTLLEGATHGDYTAGDAMLLAEVAHLKNLPHPMRFALQLNDENQGGNHYPAFINSAGCVIQDQPSGQLALYHFKWWNSTCASYLAALVTHLGGLLDGEPYFEAIILDYEQALVSDTVNNRNGSGFTHAGFVSGVTSVMAAAATAFPHTQIAWRANWGDSYHEANIAQILAVAKGYGIAWGDQDSCALRVATGSYFSDGSMPSYIDADNVFAGYGGYDNNQAAGVYTDQRGAMLGFFGAEDSELGYNSVCGSPGATGMFFNSNYFSLFNWWNDSLHAQYVNVDRNLWIGIIQQQWSVGTTSSLWDLAQNHPLTHNLCPTDHDTLFGNGTAGSGCNTN